MTDDIKKLHAELTRRINIWECRLKKLEEDIILFEQLRSITGQIAHIQLDEASEPRNVAVLHYGGKKQEKSAVRPFRENRALYARREQ